MLLIILVAGVWTVGVVTYDSIDQLKVGLVNIYIGNMIPIKQLYHISDKYSTNIVETIAKTKNNTISIRQGKEDIISAQNEIQENWQIYTKKYHRPEEEHLLAVAKLEMIKANYFIEKVISFYNNEDIHAINSLSDKEIMQSIEPIRQYISKIIELEYKKAADEKNKTYSTHKNTKKELITAFGIIISLIIILFVPILNTIRSTQKEIETQTKNLKKLNNKLTEEKGHLENFTDFLSSLNSVDLEYIASNALKRIVTATNSPIGLFYHYENRNSLRLIAKEFVDDSSLESKYFSLSNSGLPKRAIEEKQEITLTNFDEEDMPIIDTGLLKLKIKRITAFPLIFNDQRLGVIILASLSNSLNVVERKYLKGYISSLAQTLSNALEYAINQIQSVKLKQANERLLSLSITDPLTKLYNRRYLDKLFKRELDRVKRDKKYLSFIMLDIDFFKQYNDTYGHPAGDEVIKKIAQHLMDNLRRPGDLVFRLGGEEFGALFSDINEDKSIELAKQILLGVPQLKIIHAKNKVNEYVTVSIGLTVIYDNLEIAPDEIMCQSDQALYKAKHDGRNRFVLWKKEDYPDSEVSNSTHQGDTPSS